MLELFQLFSGVIIVTVVVNVVVLVFCFSIFCCVRSGIIHAFIRSKHQRHQITNNR